MWLRGGLAAISVGIEAGAMPVARSGSAGSTCDEGQNDGGYEDEKKGVHE